MTDTRRVYLRCIARIRQALDDGEPAHHVILAIDALCRSVAWQLGRTKLDVVRDCGLSPVRYLEMLYGPSPSPTPLSLGAAVLHEDASVSRGAPHGRSRSDRDA